MKHLIWQTLFFWTLCQTAHAQSDSTKTRGKNILFAFKGGLILGKVQRVGVGALAAAEIGSKKHLLYFQVEGSIYAHRAKNMPANYTAGGFSLVDTKPTDDISYTAFLITKAYKIKRQGRVWFSTGLSRYRYAERLFIPLPPRNCTFCISFAGSHDLETAIHTGIGAVGKVGFGIFWKEVSGDIAFVAQLSQMQSYFGLQLIVGFGRVE